MKGYTLRTNRITDRTRQGFTLIEMLVSTGLVILLLTLFAQIFATATRTIGDQRAIARVDQAQRVIDSALRRDLGNRTYRQRRDARDAALGIVPLAPGDVADPDRQLGYFYISENEPDNDTDDVLQLTARYPVDAAGRPSGYYEGAAGPIGRPDVDSDGVLTGTDDDIHDNGLLDGSVPPIVPGPDKDQPDYDDGLFNNGRTRSSAAEVVYFVRGDTLYRRVVLLREAEITSATDGQPKMGPAGRRGPLLSGRTAPMPEAFGQVPTRPPTTEQANYAVADEIYSLTNDSTPAIASGGADTTDWYKDLDIAAVRYDRDGILTTAGTSLHVLTVDDLDNGSGNRFSLGRPYNRYGHVPFVPVTGPPGVAVAPGFPLEYLPEAAVSGSPTPYIGRFTTGEASDPDFSYPGLGAAGGSPFHVPGLTTAGGDPRKVDAFERRTGAPGFEPSPRDGDDILATGVVRFDIEVWDDLQQRYIDIGETVTSATYFGDQDPATLGLQGRYVGVDERTNALYGPAGGPPAVYPSGWHAGSTGGVPYAQNRVFDTWHSEVDVLPFAPAAGPPIVGGDGRDEFPPLRPLLFSGQAPDVTAGTANVYGIGFEVDQVPFPPAPAAGSVLELFNGGATPAPPIARWRASPRPRPAGGGAPRETVYPVGSVAFANPAVEPYGPFDANNNYIPPFPAAAYRTHPGGTALSQAGGISPTAVSTTNYQASQPYTSVTNGAGAIYQVRPPGTEFYSQNEATNGSIAYRVVQAVDADGNGVVTSGETQPYWPTRVGDRVTDGELTWEAVDNRVGLKKFRVVIAVRDSGSDRLRQLSVEHSFVE